VLDGLNQVTDRVLGVLSRRQSAFQFDFASPRRSAVMF
jgi:hypothetical protein